MRIECVSNVTEISAGTPGVIVLPEYCDRDRIGEVSGRYPQAIVVAAIEQNGHSRAVLFHQRRNCIDYLKIGSDGRTKGTGKAPMLLPAYELPQICVGVLICMDVQYGPLVHGLVRRLESSSAPLKLICIPSFMGVEWFNSEVVNAPLNRMPVALCNHTVQDRPRCKSFISDASGNKLRVQTGVEPIAWTAAEPFWR
jgi:predicted amidohydrolase